jgi:hypothetical protein
VKVITALVAIAALLVAGGYLLGTRGSHGAAANPSAPAGSAAAPRTMNESAFWGLMENTRADADNDTGRQSGLLEERLSKLPPRQIVRFQQIRKQMDERLYTWDVWGAAYVIDDGCSDDCFRDFRAYLISLGPRAYSTALRNPDSLAPMVQDAEQGDWENADDVAPDAYQSRTGNDFPYDSEDLSGNPRGQSWNGESQQALAQRYPALAARFR